MMLRTNNLTHEYSGFCMIGTLFPIEISLTSMRLIHSKLVTTD
jgi:hypothetical protein